MFPPEAPINDWLCRASCGACTPCLPTPPPPVAPPSPPSQPPSSPSPPMMPPLPSPPAPPPARPCTCNVGQCSNNRQYGRIPWEEKCSFFSRARSFCCACEQCTSQPIAPPTPPAPLSPPFAPLMPPNWKYAGCHWPQSLDVAVGNYRATPHIAQVNMSDAMRLCADAGSGCVGIVLRRGGDTAGVIGGLYEGRGYEPSRGGDPEGIPCTYRTVPRRRLVFEPNPRGGKGVKLKLLCHFS